MLALQQVQLDRILVAEELGIPFVYVRPDQKHGRQNQIEGFAWKRH
jgi:orotate phosphoribosyltransferase